MSSVSNKSFSAVITHASASPHVSWTKNNYKLLIVKHAERVAVALRSEGHNDYTAQRVRDNYARNPQVFVNSWREKLQLVASALQPDADAFHKID